MCLIRARHRLLLTGTPLQNNLLELWALYDFVLPSLLGEQQYFKMNFVRPIVDGNDKEASENERAVGATRAKELRKKIQPFNLSRTKAEVFGNMETSQNPNASNALALKTKKTEWIIWLQLSDFQLHVYKEFLDSEQVQNALNTTRSPLAAITVLKKICDHPLLLQNASTLSSRELQSNDDESNGYMQNILREWQNHQLKLKRDADSPSASVFLTASNKLIFLVNLLSCLQKEGHKTLVFSQSVRMLKMIGECLNVAGIRYLQIDGSIIHVEDRQKLIDKFNKSSKISCFLLTTGSCVQ
jgi:SNF2 family DNA or RNA helicase